MYQFVLFEFSAQTHAARIISAGARCSLLNRGESHANIAINNAGAACLKVKCQVEPCHGNMAVSRGKWVLFDSQRVPEDMHEFMSTIIRPGVRYG